MGRTVVVTGDFDDLRSRHMRFLQEAARLGALQVLLASDASIAATRGRAPMFPEAERCYMLEALRFVDRVTVTSVPCPDEIPPLTGVDPDIWVVDEPNDSMRKRVCAASHGMAYHVTREADLAGFPMPAAPAPTAGRKKVLVTGCYDWFHSGHVRFFEEVSQLGDLYVVVGHDANVRLLKGEGHPLFPAEERRYIAQSVRYVHQALVSTGAGWMDAAPEIERIQPDIYAVNEDGDKPEKRAYCEAHGLDYVVLRRLPKPGLDPRSSTVLRGF